MYNKVKRLWSKIHDIIFTDWSGWEREWVREVEEKVGKESDCIEIFTQRSNISAMLLFLLPFSLLLLHAHIKEKRDDDGDWETCCWLWKTYGSYFALPVVNAQTRKYSFTLSWICFSLSEKRNSYFSIFLKSFECGRERNKRKIRKEIKRRKKNPFCVLLNIKKSFFIFYRNFCVPKNLLN